MATLSQKLDLTMLNAHLSKFMDMRKETPLFRGFFHFVIFLENPIQLICSLNKYKNVDALLINIVISIAIQMHVGASSLMHIINWPLPAKYYIRMFDHSAIFLYSSMGHASIWYYILRDNFNAISLVVQLSLVIFGVVWSSFVGIHKLRRSLRCLIYFLSAAPMFTVIYYLYVDKRFYLLANLTLNTFLGVLACIIYSSKLPVVVPGAVEFHEIFHFIGYLCYKLGAKFNKTLLSS